MEESKLSHKTNNLTSMNIENTIMESSNSDIVNQNHSMVTPPKNNGSQRWVTNEKRSSENNNKNNRWTSQSPDIIEEEKGLDSVSNRRSSINKQGDKVYPIGVEGIQHLTNAQIYSKNYLTVSRLDLNKNGFSDFQVSLAMTLRSVWFELIK